MASLTRHDIKKDELTEIILNCAEWIKKNRTMFFSVAGTVLGVAVLTAFFFVRFYSLKSRAIDRLAIAQGELQQGDPAKAIGQLDDVINKYANTKASFQARLSKAEYLFRQGNFDEAENMVKPVVENGKPKKIVPLAMATLGTIYESNAKYSEAIETYNKFLDKYPGHFLAPKVFESLARVYELTNVIDKAISTYEKLASLYPAPGWANRAQERINMLSGSKVRAENE